MTGGGATHRHGEDRYARFALISWWSQARLRDARVLLVGAGALGNEVLKSLALVGVGRIVVVDMDRVEESNLSRSALFRRRDVGAFKAPTACAAARELNPAVEAIPLVANVVHGVGLDLFREADVVIGALDNREARLAVNRSCQLTRRPWIDGGIEVLAGVARVFRPGDGPCYECTLSEVDWEILRQRRACSLLPRDAAAEEPRVPTTPTTAAIVGGMQAAEAIKLLHGLPGLDGEGYLYDGVGYEGYRVRYTRDPGCFAHEALPAIEDLPRTAETTTPGDLLALARERFGPDATVEACRELLGGLECAPCGRRIERFGALDAVGAEDAACPACGRPATPRAYHRLDDRLCPKDQPLSRLGLPDRDVVRVRAGARDLGWALAGSGRVAGEDA
jgi:adenylyltransferase/sulfurtransferase